MLNLLGRRNGYVAARIVFGAHEVGSTMLGKIFLNKTEEIKL